jgi:hypothetical protein
MNTIFPVTATFGYGIPPVAKTAAQQTPVPQVLHVPSVVVDDSRSVFARVEGVPALIFRDMVVPLRVFRF